MRLAKNVLGIVPGLQATALVGHNLKMLPDFKMKPSGKMKLSNKPLKRIVSTGVTNIVGVGLIKPTASMINKI